MGWIGTKTGAKAAGGSAKYVRITSFLKFIF